MIHILAFDDTDQAECGADGYHERCTANPAEVTCEDCLRSLDDIGLHP
jgi:hypothetical protein